MKGRGLSSGQTHFPTVHKFEEALMVQSDRNKIRELKIPSSILRGQTIGECPLQTITAFRLSLLSSVFALQTVNSQFAELLQASAMHQLQHRNLHAKTLLPPVPELNCDEGINTDRL